MVDLITFLMFLLIVSVILGALTLIINYPTFFLMIAFGILVISVASFILVPIYEFAASLTENWFKKE